MIFITARPLAEWEATEPCYNRCRCAPIAVVGALLVLERLPPSACHKWLTIIWLIGVHSLLFRSASLTFRVGIVRIRHLIGTQDAQFFVSADKTSRSVVSSRPLYNLTAHNSHFVTHCEPRCFIVMGPTLCSRTSSPDNYNLQRQKGFSQLFAFGERSRFLLNKSGAVFLQHQGLYVGSTCSTSGNL
jgi:hypothetical protein